MNKERNLRSLVIIAVLLSVTGISIAFAALTQTLNINGQVKITGSKWRVEFVEESLNNSIIGEAKELADPTLSATTFVYNISLTQPGDSVIYTFDVKNLGTIDAKVDTAPVLTGIPEEYEDDILYQLTYASGEEIKVGDQLNKEETRTLKLVLLFKESAESVPAEEVTMTLNASIIYIQK